MPVQLPPAHPGLTRPGLPHNPPTNRDILEADVYLDVARISVKGMILIASYRRLFRQSRVS